MRLLPVFLMLVGCAAPPPQEELALFDSAEERARRDVLAVYYWEGDAAALSVVVPRKGPAEARGPAPRSLAEVVAGAGSRPMRYSQKTGIPVEPTHRKAIEAYFADLPAGTTERTMSMKPVQSVETFESGRPDPVPPTRVRVLHVSESGDVKRLNYTKGDATLLPAGVPSGGEPLRALDRLFVELAAPLLK